MSDKNSVSIIGTLTRDPELKYTQSGTANAHFGIACHSQRKGRETVSFFRVVTWGKLAETLANHITKGSRILIDGRLNQRNWEDQQGNKRETIEIVAENVTFMSVKKREDSTAGNAADGQVQQRPEATKPSPKTI